MLMNSREPARSDYQPVGFQQQAVFGDRARKCDAFGLDDLLELWSQGAPRTVDYQICFLHPRLQLIDDPVLQFPNQISNRREPRLFGVIEGDK